MMMKMRETGQLWKRLKGKYRRTLSTTVASRPVKMRNTVPLISFTFDDFPISALEVGGKILHQHGLAGTYYVSLGLLDRHEPTGLMCSSTDLTEVVAQGHELGCHTFWHSDAWETDPRSFEDSIMANRLALSQLLPEAKFETMSYPISTPRPDTKRMAGRYFSGCRGGGQLFNAGTLDLNNMKAFFLEQSREDPAVIWEMINRNRLERGWLIFVTHDVLSQPTRFGCAPAFFEEVVRQAIRSGATILPTAEALKEVWAEKPNCA